MSNWLTLVLRSPLDTPIDMGALTAQPIESLDAAGISALPLQAGRQRAEVGELFSVRGERSTRLRLEGDLTYANGIGAALGGGELVVEGPVGDRLGASMLSGSIEVRGTAGHDVGAAMSGGTVRVIGNAGDRVGGAAPGAAKGMTGGEIVILGSTGMETAVRARRGLVVVGCDAGELAARSMIAGTLVVLGRTGANPGFGNKRGSIVAAGAISIPTTYRYACTLESTFVRMLMVYLRRRHGLSIPDAVAYGRYKRYCGDLGRPGKGEILEWSGE